MQWCPKIDKYHVGSWVLSRGQPQYSDRAPSTQLTIAMLLHKNTGDDDDTYLQVKKKDIFGSDKKARKYTEPASRYIGPTKLSSFIMSNQTHNSSQLTIAMLLHQHTDDDDDVCLLQQDKRVCEYVGKKENMYNLRNKSNALQSQIEFSSLQAAVK